MTRLLTTAFLLALFLPSAHADFRFSGKSLQLYLPQLSWALTMPREDWQIVEERRTPDSVSYFVASRAKSLQFSVFLDRTVECNSGATCRKLWRTNSSPAFKDALEPKEFERNGFSVLQFHLDKPAGTPVVQLNASAHAYRDGHWIDLRVSKVGETKPDAASLLAVIDALSFGAKSLGGPRLYPAAESSRFIELDVPTDWRDAPGRRMPGTVELRPAKDDAFQLLLTLFAPPTVMAPAPDAAEVRKQVAESAERTRAQSVEQKLELKEAKGKGAWGYHFSATDKSPGPGEYRHLTQGLLVTGNVRMMFTILWHDGQEKAAEQALNVLLGARTAP